MNKIVECVPNFSEGRDRQKVEKNSGPLPGGKRESETAGL